MTIGANDFIHGFSLFGLAVSYLMVRLIKRYCNTEVFTINNRHFHLSLLNKYLRFVKKLQDQGQYQKLLTMKDLKLMKVLIVVFFR